MKINEEISIVEAILFASGEPIEANRIAAAAGIEPDMVFKIVQLLNDRFEKDGSSMQVIKLSDSYQRWYKS